MAVNSFIANQGTQTNLLTDNTGGAAGTLIPIYKLSIDSQGTFTNGNLWNGAVTITSGSINGTVNIGNTPNIGTIGTLGLGSVVVNTLPNIPGGSIVITNGTVIGNGGSMIAYGPAAAAAAAAGNPLNIGGTDSGGTIRTIKVDSGGLQRIGIDSGTISVLPNLPQGSINVTAGTIASVGTIGTLGLGTITGNLGTIGTLGLGTITGNLGTMGTLGTVQNIGSVTNLGQVYNAGTIQAGTLGTITNLGQVYNAGTLQAGTINIGTIIKQSPAAAAGSLTAAGNITQAGSQFDTISFDIQGTWVGTVFTEGQIGTSAWFAVPNISNLGVLGTSFTGNGDYFVSAAGLDGVRARVTYSSGTLDYNTRQSNFYGLLSAIQGGSLGNIGMLNAGTISTLPNIPGGSIIVTAGTLQSLGTIGTLGLGTITGNLGTIGTLGLGSVVMTAGTLTAGTIRDVYDTIGTLTITLGTLPSSGSAGRQSTLVDNTSNLYQSAIIGVQITPGTVTAAGVISYYLLRSDNGGGPIIDDLAGATDAAGTWINAPLLYTHAIGIGTNVQYKNVFDTGPYRLGPKWGVLVVQNLGNPLNSTAGSHSITYQGIRTQIK